MMMDLDDPEGPTKSRLALLVWIAVLGFSVVIAVIYCPSGSDDTTCKTALYMIGFFIFPIIAAFIILFVYYYFMDRKAENAATATKKER